MELQTHDADKITSAIKNTLDYCLRDQREIPTHSEGEEYSVGHPYPLDTPDDYVTWHACSSFLKAIEQTKDEHHLKHVKLIGILFDKTEKEVIVACRVFGYK